MLRIACICGTIAIAGCTTSGGLFSGLAGSRSETGRDAGSIRTTINAESLAEYLTFMSDLATGDPVTQAEVFRQASQAAESAPTITNRVRLALALATPGHLGSNAEHAQRELRELLAVEELLLPEESMLVKIQLEEVEQRQMLSLEMQRLQSEITETMARQSAQSSQRIESLEAENQQLRRDLRNVQQTLNEITNIERSIRERESDTN